ncbi:helix-turn-helix transcriptional regulator [Pedobacter frigidisoli]|nr:helix-turn-helix transcriptional regulator [Pedobacter frigidisoli]
MADTRNLLNLKLFNQKFNEPENKELELDEGKTIAQVYARLENCISVLSDLKKRKSYIYYGGIAGQLGLQQTDLELNSIWEDDLLQHIHPDDMEKKMRLELQFFRLLNAVSPQERTSYEAVTRLRFVRPDGKTVLLKHRLMYISSTVQGSIRLALCLYHGIIDHPDLRSPDALILNSQTGIVIDLNREKFRDVLSGREKELLQLIGYGLKSKEISQKMNISINTVNRHRQNIFQKLDAKNAIEACRIAEVSGLLK